MTAEVQRERFSPSRNEITLLSLKLLADQNESGDYVQARSFQKPWHRPSSHGSEPAPFEPRPPTPKQPLLLPPRVASNSNGIKPQKAELSNADPPLEESGRLQVPRPSLHLETHWNERKTVRARGTHTHTLTCTRLCVCASVCVRLCRCLCVSVYLAACGH